MIFLACPVCRKAVRVHGDMEEISTLLGERSEFWPDKYKCFSCNCSVIYCLTPEVSPAALATMDVHDLTPQEAYAALNGFGVPEERTCCPEVILPLFQSLGIAVKGCRINTGTFRVEELTFPDGTTLFLAPAAVGAVVYRVRKRSSYAEKIEDPQT